MMAQLDSRLVNALKLGAGLYLLIWLAFLQFFVIFFSDLFGVDYLHFLVGFVVLVLAIVNYRGLMKTSAPDRVKRISKVIPGMVAFDGLLGIAIVLLEEGTAHWALNIMHLVVALAIIAQASSTATAYDMWEEHEFK